MGTQPSHPHARSHRRPTKRSLVSAVRPSAAPDHVALVDQQTNRYRLDPMCPHRLDGLAVRAVRLARRAQHHRHDGAINIGIQHPTARPTAIVDMPTPPLPGPTVMILRTLASGLSSPWTACVGSRGIWGRKLLRVGILAPRPLRKERIQLCLYLEERQDPNAKDLWHRC